MERVNNPYVQVRGPHPQPSTPVQYTTVYDNGVATPMQYLAPNNTGDAINAVANSEMRAFNRDVASSAGFGNDKYSYQMTPEYQQYLKALDPMFDGGTVASSAGGAVVSGVKALANGNNPFSAGAKEIENGVINRVTENLTKMYQDQGLIEKFGGFKNFNAKVQEGINNELQYGMALKRQGDPRGDQYIQHAKACQYAFNQAQPKVNQAWNTQMTAMKNKAKDFAKNNWWWMVPGGLLMMAGLFNRGNNAQQAPQQPYDPFATPKAWQGVNMQGLTFNNEQQLAKPKTQG